MNEKIGMQDLVVLLAEKANITKKDAEALIKECFEIMEEGLAEDKILKIRNLGTFKLVFVEDRESVDVSTGERVLIPAHYKVSFAPDIELAERVNAPYASLENVEVTENEPEIDDETDDENDDEFEGKFIEPGYLLTETEKQGEPEIKEVESKQEEPVEIEQEELEIEEVEEEEEKIETIYKEPEYEIEEEPVSAEQYDDEYQPVRARKGIFRIFFIIASAFILFFAGYYFCPIIRSGRWRVTPDSVIVFSYSVNKPLVSDTLEVKTQKSDSETVRILDSLRAKASGTPVEQTPKAQAPAPPKMEPKSSPKAEPAVTSKAQTAENQASKPYDSKKHKILPGERLNTIALREYGHKAFWVYIYDENRDKISKPDLIEPGMVIDIPPAGKYGIDKDNRESVEKALKLEQQYK